MGNMRIVRTERETVRLNSLFRGLEGLAKGILPEKPVDDFFYCIKLLSCIHFSFTLRLAMLTSLSEAFVNVSHEQNPPKFMT